mgnify:CR=1 FL=1
MVYGMLQCRKQRRIRTAVMDERPASTCYGRWPARIGIIRQRWRAYRALTYGVASARHHWHQRLALKGLWQTRAGQFEQGAADIWRLDEATQPGRVMLPWQADHQRDMGYFFP